jgi:hypothetical protein
MFLQCMVVIKILNWELSFNIYRQYWARKPEPLEETYAVRESRPLYHIRNGLDWESNPRPQRWQALMLISNTDLTTVLLWQPWQWYYGQNSPFPSRYNERTRECDGWPEKQNQYTCTCHFNHIPATFSESAGIIFYKQWRVCMSTSDMSGSTNSTGTLHQLFSYKTRPTLLGFMQSTNYSLPSSIYNYCYPINIE